MTEIYSEEQETAVGWYARNAVSDPKLVLAYLAAERFLNNPCVLLFGKRPSATKQVLPSVDRVHARISPDLQHLIGPGANGAIFTDLRISQYDPVNAGEFQSSAEDMLSYHSGAADPRAV